MYETTDGAEQLEAEVTWEALSSRKPSTAKARSPTAMESGEVLRTKKRSFPSTGRLTAGRTRTTTCHHICKRNGDRPVEKKRAGRANERTDGAYLDGGLVVSWPLLGG